MGLNVGYPRNPRFKMVERATYWGMGRPWQTHAVYPTKSHNWSHPLNIDVHQVIFGMYQNHPVVEWRYVMVSNCHLGFRVKIRSPKNGWRTIGTNRICHSLGHINLVSFPYQLGDWMNLPMSIMSIAGIYMTSMLWLWAMRY